MLDRTLSVAPMMAWTTRHERFFLRQITHRTLLYTEMVTSGALLHGEAGRLLAHHPDEAPLALQLGGCDPGTLADCARLAQEHGFSEVNLNVGCPSDRVKNARFGAALMAEPERVARCVAAMRQACNLPVTVKTRIGIDDMDSHAALERFVNTVSAASCGTFIIHARKAWLQGLSPKENREVPPLDYGRVYRLKQEHPDLEIIINGGIKDLSEADTHRQHVDGVMLGRAAYKTPYLLAQADGRYFGAASVPPSRDEVVYALLPYIENELAQGAPLKNITRHILGLFQGQPGARAWRRYLSENAQRPDAGADVVRAAHEKILQARAIARQKQAA
jgi:tRNA-dihydrouridine synthase A